MQNDNPDLLLHILLRSVVQICTTAAFRSANSAGIGHWLQTISYKLHVLAFDCSGCGPQLPVLQVRAPGKRRQSSPCSSQPVLLRYVGTGGKWTSAPGSNTRWRRADFPPRLCHLHQQDTNTCLRPQRTFRVSNLLNYPGGVDFRRYLWFLATARN